MTDQELDPKDAGDPQSPTPGATDAQRVDLPAPLVADDGTHWKPREKDAAYVSEDAIDGDVPHRDAGTVAHSHGVVYVDSEAQQAGDVVADDDTAPEQPDPEDR
ncbi:hypothetical protein [Pseudonocardia pini]|uniref:hypothetical protein n=1 Tax=Pseudonocardia pini TaxID=2758030 RepID=UPI0015F072A4|nr:hypothetical protein [Pseudonocardia pini]